MTANFNTFIKDDNMMHDFMVYPKATFMEMHKDITAKQYIEAVKEYNTFKNADMLEQQVIFNEWYELMAEYRKGDESWLRYDIDHMARLVKLDCGRIIEIEKPRINTQFCFGYGTFETDNRASDMAYHVTVDGGEYFKEENLKKIDKKIAELEGNPLYGYNRGDKGYSGGSYYYGADDRIGYLWFGNEADKHDRLSEEQRESMIPLTDNDKANLIQAYRIERCVFEKRLNAYLKKYGTSKLRTWTYWEDE